MIYFLGMKKQVLSPSERYLKDIRSELQEMKELQRASLFYKPGKFLANNFSIGILRGLGAAFGVTILIGLVGYILQALDAIPFVEAPTAENLTEISENYDPSVLP